jgi:hypothetical protein
LIAKGGASGDTLSLSCSMSGESWAHKYFARRSGTIADTESTLCEGFDENDRRTVCVEDLRDVSKQADIAAEKKLNRRKEATCGIGQES